MFSVCIDTPKGPSYYPQNIIFQFQICCYSYLNVLQTKKTNINFRGQAWYWPPAKCWVKDFNLHRKYHAPNFYRRFCTIDFSRNFFTFNFYGQLKHDIRSLGVLLKQGSHFQLLFEKLLENKPRNPKTWLYTFN